MLPVTNYRTQNISVPANQTIEIVPANPKRVFLSLSQPNSYGRYILGSPTGDEIPSIFYRQNVGLVFDANFPYIGAIYLQNSNSSSIPISIYELSL